MSLIVVDIADMGIASDPDDTLVTYSLGSCIGVTIYDPALRIGGMVHCMLPLSKTDRAKAKARPSMFVDTGVTLLLSELFQMGLRKSRAIVKVAGASSILDRKGLLRIGERNYTVFRKIMWKNGMMIESEDIGGEISRTMRLHLADGTVTIRSKGKEVPL